MLHLLKITLLEYRNAVVGAETEIQALNHRNADALEYEQSFIMPCDALLFH